MKISNDFAVVLGNMSKLVNNAAEIVGYAALTHVVKFRGRDDGLVIYMTTDLTKGTYITNNLEIKAIDNAITDCTIDRDDFIHESNHYEILTEASLITGVDNGEILNYSYDHEMKFVNNDKFDSYHSSKVINLTEEQFELNKTNVKVREAKIMNLS